MGPYAMWQADVDLAWYCHEFRDVPRFLDMCRQCPNYGRLWSCPPLVPAASDVFSRYGRMRLFAVRVDVGTGVPAGDASRITLPVRLACESMLVRLEKELGGTAFSYVGDCVHCPGLPCARTQGLPCRHPKKVRPSLEAHGFDLGRTADRIFGRTMLWGKDGILPEHLLIVTGVAY